jgi:hypothetical protein
MAAPPRLGARQQVLERNGRQGLVPRLAGALPEACSTTRELNWAVGSTQVWNRIQARNCCGVGSWLIAPPSAESTK